MPRGFYTREILHPYFTTKEYQASDQYRHEVEAMLRMQDRWHKAMEALKKTLRRPRKNPWKFRGTHQTMYPNPLYNKQ